MRAVNLIPSEQRSGASVGAGRSEGAAYAVLVLVAGLAAMAGLYGAADHHISSRKAEAARISAKATQASAEASQLSPYSTFISLRQQRQQAVETLADARFDWAHAFHEFGRVMPKNVSISALSGTIAGSAGGGAVTSSSSSPSASASASVTPATPPGAVPTFSVTGCASSQTTVAETLDRLRLIDGVANVTLQSSTRSSAGAGASGSGGCPGGDPVFSATVTFQPLPTAAASVVIKPQTTVASDNQTGSSSSGSLTTGTAR